MDVDGAGSNLQDQTVKRLVRYALACEYQRVRITRAGINEKGKSPRLVVRQVIDYDSHWQAAGSCVQAHF